MDTDSEAIRVDVTGSVGSFPAHRVAAAAHREPGRHLMRLRRTSRSGVGDFLDDVRTGRFERTLAGLTAAGALITTAEIYTSHDGASFGNKMMWWPIFITPTLVPAGIAGVVSRRAARTVLPVASAIVVANGLQGTFLHARGIAQKPGGWKLAAYNLEMGPPLFAPGLAALVGGMGLLASVLRREGDSSVQRLRQTIAPGA